MSSTKLTKPHRDWFKSSFSASSNNCVEVRFDGDTVLVRDDKYSGPTELQPVVAIPVADWNAFLELTLEHANHGDRISIPTVTTDHHGTIIRDAVGTTLEFTPVEWIAFVSGVRAGEFTPATVRLS